MAPVLKHSWNVEYRFTLEASHRRPPTTDSIGGLHGPTQLTLTGTRRCQCTWNGCATASQYIPVCVMFVLADSDEAHETNDKGDGFPAVNTLSGSVTGAVYVVVIGLLDYTAAMIDLVINCAASLPVIIVYIICIN